MPAPGSVLLVRDEEWLVTKTFRSADGAWFVDVQGLSELVRDTSATSATFSTALDQIELLDPAEARVVADDTPGYRRSRLLDGLTDVDREDALRREKSLLYVSASRARDELVVVWTGEPSELLPSTTGDF